MENSNLQNTENEKSNLELIKSLSSLDYDLLKLSKNDLQKVIKLATIDKLKDKVNLEVKKNNFDLHENVTLWLNQFQSHKTKSLYKRNLQRFLEWIEKKNLSILEVKSKEVFEYISFLNSLEKTNNYKNSIISAVSSFCSFLTTIDILDKNYFLKIKSKPRQQRYNKKKENIPTETDLKNYFDFIYSLIESNKKQVKSRAIKVLISSKILLNNGLRIGSLDDLILNKDGRFTTYSKGKRTMGSLDTESRDLLKFYFNFTHGKFSEIALNSHSLRNFFIKHKFNFSSHSFRHLFSIRHYQKNRDIYKLSRLLNHANIGITGTYLASLNIDIEDNAQPNFDVQNFNEIENSLEKISKKETEQKKEYSIKMSQDRKKKLDMETEQLRKYLYGY